MNNQHPLKIFSKYYWKEYVRLDRLDIDVLICNNKKKNSLMNSKGIKHNATKFYLKLALQKKKGRLIIIKITV